MSSSAGFQQLVDKVNEVVNVHYNEIIQWDKDMTEEPDTGILSLLSSTEATLNRLRSEANKVSKLIELQKRYRQDTLKIKNRVLALYEKASEEDISETDSKRQEMYDRSKSVSDAIKDLKERVKITQEAFQHVDEGTGGSSQHEEKLGEMRSQIRLIAERLRRLRHEVLPDDEEDVKLEYHEVPADDQADAPPPITSSIS